MPSQTLPQKLASDFLDNVEKLSREQAGHLRHFHNLSTQRDGEWGVMGTQDPGQEWLDAYRYQLATMAYAAGATHFHRMPALRSLFKSLLQNIIKKMLRREVWGYWFLTSHSGTFVDPDLKELRKPWADPIVRENIMYSGHLLLMVSLFAMLFNDDVYNEDGALTFVWSPIFWGMGPEKFSYTRQSLQKAILAEMERENWLGVCCEPNSIFVVCNQFPIIAMRYNDVRDGTNIASDVLQKYSAAWKSKGMIQGDGLFINWYSPKQDSKQPARDVGFTAWAAAFMNAWNPTVAHGIFETQRVGFLTRAETDRINVNSSEVASVIRNFVQNEGDDPYSLATLKKALQYVQQHPSSELEPPFHRPMFGYILKWVSEVGDRATLDGLLTHVDRFFKKTWQDGGLYYLVNEQRSDEHGNWTEVDPFTGNSAVGYARLNVFDGQRKMWTDPWTSERVSAAPHIEGVDLASGVDFLRGCWEESARAMVITMRSWNETVRKVSLKACSLPVGRYGVYFDGNLTDIREIFTPEETIEILVDVNGDELDLVLLLE